MAVSILLEQGPGDGNVTRRHDLSRNSAQLTHHVGFGGDAEEGSEFRTMTTKATEQKQDSAGQYTNLDNRYGKIGISAVAAAVCHQGEQRNVTESHPEPYDRD